MKDLTYMFNVRQATASEIFRGWLPVIAKTLLLLIKWPHKDSLRRNLPKAFRKKYRSCVSIIDCTEVFIERPLNLHARAQTW